MKQKNRQASILIIGMVWVACVFGTTLNNSVRPATADRAPNLIPTSTPIPSPTPTPTSVPGPPTLIAPEDDALLPQPVAPNQWVFEWVACGPPVGWSSVYIYGPGELSLGGACTLTSHCQYVYTSTDYLPTDMLGPWHWLAFVYKQAGSNRSETRTFWVEPADTEINVLYQTSQMIGCSPGISVEDAIYSLNCITAAGHSADAQIQRFDNEFEAQTAFEMAQGTLVLQSFHCYPAYEWLHEQGTIPMRQQGHSWVVDRWLVTTHSVDDTGIPIAPSPVTVSEAIYSAAIMNQLFQACDIIYLPLVLRSQ